MPTFMEKASLDWSDDSIRLINTPSAHARSSYFYMQEAGYFKTKPPYFTERAGLSSFLIVYTISGHGVLHYLGNEYRLSAGQCFFIHCMNHHDYATLEGCEWEFLWLHFNGSSSLDYYSEFEENGFEIIDIHDRFLFESTLRRIVAINQQKRISCELLTANLILNLLTELLIANSTDQAVTLHVPSHIKECAKYIDTHFQEDISLDALADYCHISKYYLSHEFKKYMGSSLQDYLITARITYAKELLKYTDQSISDITFSCGMRNVSHFINQFKAREQMTPLAYRKGWK